MKKLLSICFCFLINLSLFAKDFSIRLLPSYDISSESNFKQVLSGTIALDFSPITIRKVDDLFISAQGSGFLVSPKPLKSFNILDATFALGYNAKFTDRFGATLEGGVGFWKINEVSNVIDTGFSGLSFLGRLTGTFQIIPELSVGAFVGYKSFFTKPEILSNDIQVGLSLKYSFSKGLFSKSEIKNIDEENSFDILFPVFYSRYDDHSFGFMNFQNNEKYDIKDIEVSIFIEQFMQNPNVCAKFDEIKRGETFSIDLTAFLDEGILNVLTPQKTDVVLNIKYKILGKTINYSKTVELTTVSRNSMTWEDDRRAAAFVSASDGTASAFAKQVKSITKSKIKNKSEENFEYAKALFEALKEFGINYVIDPTSSFVDNIGSSNVDFLQFPYQTLLYHGGDCDDLSILNCALFEAIGINSAFITIPGHIFIAFDSGLNPQEVNSSKYVIQDGIAWIPLEITLCQDTFELEMQTGLREWNLYPNERALIPLFKAWEEYPAVGIPDSEVRIR